MKRLFRRAFNFAAVVSAVLLAAVLLAWIYGCRAPAPVLPEGSNWGYGFSLSCGAVSLRYRRPVFVSAGLDLEDESAGRMDGTHAVTIRGPRWRAPGINANRLVLVIFNPGRRDEIPIGWEFVADCRMLCLAAAVMTAAAAARGLARRAGGRAAA